VQRVRATTKTESASREEKDVEGVSHADQTNQQTRPVIPHETARMQDRLPGVDGERN
jgi:hypothetical protein